jgi:hypothetical protein
MFFRIGKFYIIKMRLLSLIFNGLKKRTLLKIFRTSCFFLKKLYNVANWEICLLSSIANSLKKQKSKVYAAFRRAA